MKKEEFIAIAIIVVIFIGIIFIVNIPTLIAFNWDWRCLVADCRILK